MKLFTFALVAILTLSIAALLGACGGAANTPANTAANTANKSNTTTANTAPANTATTPAANTEVAKKDDAPAGDSVGVPECDEYIKKYEACLTKIAAKAPQVESAMKSAFQAQRSGFKSAASTPQGKTALASTCKSAIESAKASTSAYACEW